MIQFSIREDITLRMLRTEEAPTLFEVVDENRKHLREWLPWLDVNQSIKDSESFIESSHAQYKNDLGFMCGIFFKDKLVGMCGYHPIDKANRSVTIGYWLAEAAQGMGIVTSCARFLIDYAFNVLKLNKVCIPAAESNLKSQAVSQRLGLFNEGVDREAEFLYDYFVNHVRYSVLRSEWQS